MNTSPVTATPTVIPLANAVDRFAAEYHVAPLMVCEFPWTVHDHPPSVAVYASTFAGLWLPMTAMARNAVTRINGTTTLRRKPFLTINRLNISLK
jgi:hypothetical protein